MKKITYLIVSVALLLSLLPTASIFAATLPTCSISTWQVNLNGTWISGGCTCHVAERVKAATGKLIPWRGNADRWWVNSTWVKNSDAPRKGAIAAFSYGHVAYVESVTYKTKTSPIKIQTASYTMNWVKYSATLYKVTETYTVTLSHKDYTRILKGDNSIRYTTFESKQDVYYWETVNLRRLDTVSWRSLPTKPNNLWVTPRIGGASSLQGFIYP